MTAAPLSSWRTVRLVAWREIVVRVRERSFLISGALTLVLIAGITLIPALLGANDAESIAAVDPAAEQVAREAARAVEAQGEDVEVRRLSPAAAERFLQAGEVSLVIAADAIRAREEPSASLVAALQQAHGRRATAQALARAGLDPRESRRALSPAPLAVDVAEPSDPQSDARAGIAFLAVLVLYVQLLTYGFFVASGVVEEKASRVVELLLAAVRPRDLLAGKLLGIGVLGLAQLTVLSGVGLAAGAATGRLDVDADVVSAVALTLVWFLLGYAFYASLYACAGALVPRQEELQSVTMPLTLLIVVCFMVSFSVMEDPGGTVARVSAFLPPMAPMTLPPRIALGEASAIEIAGGALLTLAATVALVPLAARVYAGALLGTRTRVRLRDAWRGDRN